jgi:putative Mn2+ efflux pump MntP
VAVALAMDVFAVSLGVGTSGRAADLRARLRLAFHFGFFQGAMTVLGWLLGEAVSAWIASWDHWVALVLLAFVGGRMIREGLQPDRVSLAVDPTRGSAMLIVCLATSIDALAVGLSLAILGVSILPAALVIGLVSFVLGLMGMQAGGMLGSRFGPRMEIVGGLLLIAIGIRVVLAHLG